MSHTTIDHVRVDNFPVSSTHEIGLGRGRLGTWIQEVIDAGWSIETKWFAESKSKRWVIVQFTTGSWSKGTYRQVGGSDANDFETAFLRAYTAWESVAVANGGAA